MQRKPAVSFCLPRRSPTQAGFPPSALQPWSLSRVYSVRARRMEPQRRDERREKSEGEGVQPNHYSVTDVQMPGNGPPLRPSQCNTQESRISSKIHGEGT
jgi:hypothetical protein